MDIFGCYGSIVFHLVQEHSRVVGDVMLLLSSEGFSLVSFEIFLGVRELFPSVFQRKLCIKCQHNYTAFVLA